MHSHLQSDKKRDKIMFISKFNTLVPKTRKLVRIIINKEDLLPHHTAEGPLIQLFKKIFQAFAATWMA